MFLEGLGLFVLEWCHPVLPVLSAVRIYIDEPGGIVLVQGKINMYFCGFVPLIKHLRWCHPVLSYFCGVCVEYLFN